MKYRFIFLITLMLCVQVGRAQEEVPFPPESSDIVFGANVELIEMRLESRIIQEADPFIVSTEYLAIITDEGDVYPFPDSLAEVPFYRGDQHLFSTHVNNMIYLHVPDDERGSTVAHYWLFDLTTGTYTQLNELPEYVDTYCGALLLDGIDDKAWRFIIGRNGQQHACNITTGLMTPPLPAGYEWQIPDIRPPDYMPLISHDYLLLVGQPIDPADSNARLLIFDFASGEVSTVADFTRGNQITISQVPDFEDTFLLSSRNVDDAGTTTPVARYWVDLNAMSIHEIPSMGSYYTNPPRLQSWREIETPEGIAREITIFNLLTEAQSVYTFEPSCAPAVGYENTTIYYCRVIHPDGTQVDVVRTDVLTTQCEVRYTGEVEKIQWISVNERYLLLLVDDNGVIDNVDPTAFRALVGGTPVMALIDTQSGHTLLEIDAFTGGIADTWMPNVLPLDDKWVELHNGVSGMGLLHIDDDEATAYPLNGSVGSEIANDWVIFFPDRPYNDTRFFEPVRLYQLGTEQQVDLIEVNRQFYDLRGIKYMGDTTFEVTVGYQVQDWGEVAPLYDLAVYTIRVAGVDLEAP